MPGVNCLYTNDWLFILFYVDDIIVLYYLKHLSKYEAFEKELTSVYEIHVLGDIENFLGIRVLRNRPERKLTFVLDGYIERVADRFDIPLDITFPYIPLSPYSDLILFEGQASFVQFREY